MKGLFNENEVRIMKINQFIKLTIFGYLVFFGIPNALFAAGTGTFAENAAKLAEKQTDAADTKWIMGKTFSGLINMPLPKTGIFAKAMDLFTGPYKNELPFKLEFRGTLLDKLNPFRKDSYWRLYVYEPSKPGSNEQPKLIDIHGDLEYKVENGILKLYLYNGSRKIDMRLALTASCPITEIKKTNDINLKLGNKSNFELKPEKGTRLENVTELNLLDTSKGVLRQLKDAMTKSGATELAKKAIVSALGLVKALL